MYDNDEYGHGSYGSYYGNRGHNPSERWEDDSHYSRPARNQPQQHRSPYGNTQDRYRHDPRHQQQSQRGGQYSSGGQYPGSSYDSGRYGSSNRNYGQQNRYSGSRSYSGPDNEPWPHYHDNDGYAHGRVFVPEDRGWIDRTTDEVRSWFGDDEAELRRRLDRYDEEAYPRDYYGRRFRWERWREQQEHMRAAAPYYGPPYGPNVGADF